MLSEAPLQHLQEPTGEGQSTFVGALAALAAYYNDTRALEYSKLDLGWSNSNRSITAKSRPNIKI